MEDLLKELGRRGSATPSQLFAKNTEKRISLPRATWAVFDPVAFRICILLARRPGSANIFCIFTPPFWC